jgi:protein FAM50
MGDFHGQFKRPDAGSFTVEGNVSGSRAAMLERKRQVQQDEFEAEKAKRIRADVEGTSAATRDISSKFQPARIGSIQEQAFRQKTIGLVTAQEFLSAAQQSEEPTLEERAQKAKEEAAAFQLKNKLSDKAKKKKRKEKKKIASRLSFAEEGDDEDGDDEEDNNTDGAATAAAAGTKTKIAKKDPTVDTSFLPDQQREEEEKAKRLQLEQEWKDRQVEIQKEQLEITYSYWDGSGHRRSCTVSKGSSIGDFLELVRQELCKDFREMTHVASDALLYVKEDLILPHDITFYDLIVTKARGKSGPLFHFDVHDDVRVGPLDSRVEKDESHPGKVVERRWYERNKHIFPSSRWEIYDPAKDYGTYTIHGGEVTTKN